MRIIDSYATLTGSKIESPYIFESYFPLEFEKYITIQSSTQFDSRNYSYWQEVVDMLLPILKKEGISILQVGVSHEQKLANVYSLIGKTNINQLAYIIKNSIAHIGPDSFCTHLASYYDKAIVGIFSSNHIEISKPVFGNPNNLKTIESYSRTGNKKPSFSSIENPKTINLIKPEEICESLLSLLKIEQPYKVESLFFGKSYPNISIEIIPDSPHIFNLAQEVIPNIRFDYLKDKNITNKNLENCIANLLNRKCGIITHKAINLEIFKNENIKKNLASFIFHIEKEEIKNIEEHIKFIINAKKDGFDIRVALIEKNFTENEICDLKLKFLNIQPLMQLNQTSLEECLTDQDIKKINHLTIFKSSRIIASNGKTFLSKTAYLEDKPSSSLHQKISEINNLNSLGKELEHSYIYNISN